MIDLMSRHIRLVILLVMVLVTISLAGCWDNIEVEDMAYVVSIGLDKGTQNKLKISLLIAIPKNIVSAGGGGGAGGPGENGGGSDKGQASSELVAVEAPTIPAGMNMVNAFISRKVSLAHLKAVVFSEDLAKEGVGDYLDFFERNREIRGTANVIVSKGSSYDFLKSLRPVLETNPSKYIELTAHAYVYTAFIADTSIGEFIRDAQSYDKQPIAVLGGINKQAVEWDEPISFMGPLRKEADMGNPYAGDYIAGKIPRKGVVDRELMGTAVFNGDKMVGELSGTETAVMMIIRGDYRQNFWSIRDPLMEGYYIPLDIRMRKSPSIKVKRRGDKFEVSVKLRLEGNILAVQSGIDYEREQYRSILENSVEETITGIAGRVIKIAQQEYKSDVFGLGGYARRTFLLQDDWEKANWKRAFTDADIKVETEFHIRRAGLLYKANPIISSDGKKKTGTQR